MMNNTISNPSTTPLLPPPTLPSQPHQPPFIQGGAIEPSSFTTPLIREYRKGNWTIQETLILITAKKLDDERRLKTTTTSSNLSTPSSSTPACGSRNTGELRWKWVENYCWSHGCLRSQNQCNDKWDNLLRDYKKVRDYETKSSLESSSDSSYWILNKQQRKELNLPSNLVFEMYQAISEVLQRKQTQRITTTQPQPLVTKTSSPPPLQTIQIPLPPPLPLPPPPPLPIHQPPLPQAPVSSTTPTVSERSQSSKGTEDSDDEDDGSEFKRRKIRNLGSSIMKSATVLAQALKTCEEKKEKRHIELMKLEQRRIQVEEARNEVHRQGIATLIAAVTNLSGAIQSLINNDQRHGQR
ncbi:hypothetical protein TanjilG_19246 [Lupinus angustifolius]|uniref:Myb-like domain-containing protein n=1 Tax=Lupinus angustifolius TaxID=3871 RepID=A0A1J7G5H3_LUPAN|nr:PREDICTED: trihelix transcription factor GTL1-like [Lupinus angustifolius]OIV89569.1 hypothetical protein TanjilG_19246 [Lupinus angustifolius]